MNKELPLVSIGLPIYNRAEGLERTLNCFVNQTYSNIEIIIADNCSPDPEVEKIARAFAAKDKRISYYRHDSNKGWGYNTNFVIEKARGEYFMRATDDDWWDVTYIEKILTLMLSDEQIIVGTCNFLEVDINGNKSKIHLSNHLPLLQLFTTNNDIENIKNYVSQFEGFGKAILYSSLLKVKYLRVERIQKIIASELLAGDLLVGLFLLLNGKLSVYPEILYKGTYNNVRFYDTKPPKTKTIDLLILVIDYGVMIDVFNKWNKYFFKQFKFVSDSSLKTLDKLKINLVICKRLSFFYFDIMCLGFRTRGFDIFNKIKRKHILQ